MWARVPSTLVLFHSVIFATKRGKLALDGLTFYSLCNILKVFKYSHNGITKLYSDINFEINSSIITISTNIIDKKLQIGQDKLAYEISSAYNIRP